MSLLAEEPGQQLFNALADPTRRSIVELLSSKGQMSATEIYQNFEMSDPAVSQHLKVLREAELVRIEKDAQRHLYSLNPRTMRSLEDWVRRATDLWDDRFDRLERVLGEEERKTKKRR